MYILVGCLWAALFFAWAGPHLSELYAMSLLVSLVVAVVAAGIRECLEAPDPAMTEDRDWESREEAARRREDATRRHKEELARNHKPLLFWRQLVAAALGAATCSFVAAVVTPAGFRFDSQSPTPSPNPDLFTDLVRLLLPFPFGAVVAWQAYTRLPLSSTYDLKDTGRHDDEEHQLGLLAAHDPAPVTARGLDGAIVDASREAEGSGVVAPHPDPTGGER